MRYIALLDCNNFFVSCERLFRPDLRGKPVVVLSSNDGCVVARSQEIKDIGVPMGVPYFQIKDILKDNGAVSFSSNFTLYRDISRRVFSVVRSMCKEFEQYSIDEGFFYLEAEGAEEKAQEIKARIEQVVGIPVSIGIATSKTIAKYAAKRAKKTGGVCLLTASEWLKGTGSVALGEIWGVGPSRVRALTENKLGTVAQLLNVDAARLLKLYGIEGVRLQRELAGVAVYPVSTEHSQKKSIMSSRSFEKTTNKLAILQDAVAYHARRVIEELRSEGLVAGKLSLYMRSSRHQEEGYGGVIKELVLTAPTADIFLILPLVAAEVVKCFDPRVVYKKVGITASDLTPVAYVSESLWGATSTSGGELQSVLETINRAHGQDMVQVGSHLKTNVWRSKRESLSPAYTTRWEELVRVRA